MRPTRHDRFEELFRANYAAVRGYALRRAPRDVAQDVVASDAVVSQDAGDHVGDAELVRTALAGLSEHHREALTLVAWHGLTGARAARAAGCSSATFAVRLHRARAKLAARLAALEQEPAEARPLEVS